MTLARSLINQHRDKFRPNAVGNASQSASLPHPIPPHHRLIHSKSNSLNSTTVSLRRWQCDYHQRQSVRQPAVPISVAYNTCGTQAHTHIRTQGIHHKISTYSNTPILCMYARVCGCCSAIRSGLLVTFMAFGSALSGLKNFK